MVTFVVRRTSNYERSVKPCEEAVFMKKNIQASDGTDVLVVYWFVNINTIEELMEFISKHGKIVVKEKSYVPIIDISLPEIEIYDEHRE